jgi:hypothetical protein
MDLPMPSKGTAASGVGEVEVLQLWRRELMAGSMLLLAPSVSGLFKSNLARISSPKSNRAGREVISQALIEIFFFGPCRNTLDRFKRKKVAGFERTVDTG